MNCAFRIQSQAIAIPIYDSRTFEAIITLPDDIVCNMWVNDSKISSLEAIIRSTLNGNLCRAPSVRCTVGSVLTCVADPSEATYM